MNLALLAGTSIKNEAWIEGVNKEVTPYFDTTYVHHYRHWGNLNESFDLDYEVQVFSKQLSNWDENYAVFAKSAGTWVVLNAINDKLIGPKKCVFVGVAVNFGRDNNVPIDKWLNNYSTPTLFVQKTSDPAIGFSDLEALLKKRNVSNSLTVEIAGNDHDYNDVAILGDLSNNFLN